MGKKATYLLKVLKKLPLYAVLAVYLTLKDILRGIFLFCLKFTKIGKAASQKTLYAYFDLHTCPPTFDYAIICTHLIIECEKRKCNDIFIVFYPKFTHEIRQSTSPTDEWSLWRFQNIVLPTFSLFPKIRYLVAPNFWKALNALPFLKRVYPMHPLFRTTRATEKAHKQMFEKLDFQKHTDCLRAHNQAKTYLKKWHERVVKKRKIIVITIRQRQHVVERNPDLQAWGEFVKNLDKKKFFPVVVKDTDCAFEEKPKELEGCYFLDAACWNVGIRVALYESAYLNFIVNTGPFLLLTVNPRCRYILFIHWDDNVPVLSTSFIRAFFPVGKTPKFATPYQKWIWQKEDLLCIEKEFSLMCKKIEAR